MKFVCAKCLKLVSEKEIIRMPFESEEQFWCEDCHNKWDSEEKEK